MQEILGPGPGGAPWRDRAGNRSVVAEIEDLIAAEGLDPSGEGDALEARRQQARRDVWGVRLWGAHGAQIAADRIDALDLMGIERQLIFAQFMESPLNADCPEGAEAVRRYNDYLLDWCKGGEDRLLSACLLNTYDRDIALAEAERVLERGAAGLQLPGILPPAGLGPCAPEWSPLWAMLSDAGVPALLHYGGSGGYDTLIHESWYRAAWRSLVPPADDPDVDVIHAPPFIWMTSHLFAEITLTFMVLGGVFERYPDLRFGVIESGASWVASWCDRMDTVATTTSRYISRQLPLKPSEYVRRQVRVTPFNFEPVGDMMERGGLQEVYAFSTDYPHIEGGVDPMHSFHASVAPLGDGAVERFFVTNASDLFRT